MSTGAAAAWERYRLEDDNVILLLHEDEDIDDEMALAKITSLDHDLLVKLDTKLDGLTSSFSEVRSAVAAKADNVRVDKLEATVESIQSKIYFAVGGLAVLEFGLRWWLK